MPIFFDTTISFDDPDLKRFIYNAAQDRHVIEPPTPPGFTHNPADRRPSGHPQSERFPVTYLVEEHWQLYEGSSGTPQNPSQDGASVGIHRVTVAFGQDLEMTAEYWLFFRDGISDAAIDHGLDLLSRYDPDAHGEDVEAWVAANLGPLLTMDDFVLDTAITLEKRGSRYEVDTSQRDALLGMHAQGEDTVGAGISIVGDYTMRTWSREHGVTLKPIHEELIIDDGEAPTNPMTTEVVTQGGANDPAKVNAALNRIVAALKPVDCGVMNHHQLKLLSLAAWPEFKIEWVRRQIRIGCSRITVTLPVLRVRISRLVFYVYFAMPQSVGQLIFRIAETCAVRSALASAVIGIVASNPAAATASFTPLFRRCMEREIIRCLHPGILLMKEHGGWS